MTATEVEVTIAPTLDRVLILPDEVEGKSKGGIFLPDNAKEIPMRGTVLAVGPGRRGELGELLPVPFTEGDYVLYKRYQGITVECGGRELRMLPADDIWGKITAEAAQ